MYHSPRGVIFLLYHHTYRTIEPAPTLNLPTRIVVKAVVIILLINVLTKVLIKLILLLAESSRNRADVFW